MADKYLLEDGSGGYLLEDGSGYYLLETPPSPFSQSDWPLLARPKQPQDAAAAANLLPINTPAVVVTGTWRSPLIITIYPTKKAAQESAPWNNSIYQPVVVAGTPNNQDLWDNPSKAKPAQDAGAPPNLNPLYYPNPSSPFNQDLWEGQPRGKPSQDSSAAANLLPLNTPVVVAAPFNQDLWDLTPRRRAALVDAVEILLPIYSPFNPFTNQTEPVAFKRQSLKSDIYVNLLPIQTAIPAIPPFYQNDWSGVATRRAVAKVDDVELLLAQYHPNPSAPFVISMTDGTKSPMRSAAKVDDVMNFLPIQNYVPPPPSTFVDNNPFFCHVGRLMGHG